MTAAKPTHAELQAATVELLGSLRYAHLHVRKSIGRRGGKAGWQTTTNLSGWPDILCWKPGSPRILAIEIKVPPDKLSPDQEAVLRSLDASGVECFVIRPGDLPELANILQASGSQPLHPLRWPPSTP